VVCLFWREASSIEASPSPITDPTHITLQRAKTAVDAIHTIDALLTEYGYKLGGRVSFSISDQSGTVDDGTIGRGKYLWQVGSCMVAQKIPDGIGHANRGRGLRLHFMTIPTTASTQMMWWTWLSIMASVPHRRIQDFSQMHTTRFNFCRRVCERSSCLVHVFDYR
jgi:hypothetical protein